MLGINDRKPERHDHSQNIIDWSLARDTPLIKVLCESMLSRSDPDDNPDAGSG